MISDTTESSGPAFSKDSYSAEGSMKERRHLGTQHTVLGTEDERISPTPLRDTELVDPLSKRREPHPGRNVSEIALEGRDVAGLVHRANNERRHLGTEHGVGRAVPQRRSIATVGKAHLVGPPNAWRLPLALGNVGEVALIGGHGPPDLNHRPDHEGSHLRPAHHSVRAVARRISRTAWCHRCGTRPLAGPSGQRSPV